MLKVCFLNILDSFYLPYSSVDVSILMVEISVFLLDESSGSWVEFWWKIKSLGLLIGSGGSSLSFLGTLWVGSLSSSGGILFLSGNFLAGLLGGLNLWVGGDGSILTFAESSNSWVNSSTGESLFEVLLLSLVDEESLLEIFLGLLH